MCCTKALKIANNDDNIETERYILPSQVLAVLLGDTLPETVTGNIVPLVAGQDTKLSTRPLAVPISKFLPGVLFRRSKKCRLLNMLDFECFVSALSNAHTYCLIWLCDDFQVLSLFTEIGAELLY